MGSKNLKNIWVLLLVSSVILLSSSNFIIYTLYYNCLQKNNELIVEQNKLVIQNYDLNEAYQVFRRSVLKSVEVNCTAVTIEYFTNFSNSEQLITLSVPYEKYNSTIYSNYPTWTNQNLEPAKNYITHNETIINQIVETVETQTQNEEELANALLDFVQDKQNGLSIRYYPTRKLKYPIETLVEMGGDCDTHAILYATLMKAAKFKVLLLYSNQKIDGQHHVAIGVHLEKTPQNSQLEVEDSVFIYNGEKYYYAETTTWGWRVGDLPPKFQNLTFQMMPL
jgi:hypothetical protein